jgi:hypothetical protein
MSYCSEEDVQNRLHGLVTRVEDEPVVRGATAGGKDTLEHTGVINIVAINNTAKGGQAADAPDYVLTTDYLLTDADQVDWSPAGANPVAAATYYVTYRYYSNASERPGVVSAVQRANSRVNMALAGRYPVPVKGVSFLKELATILAVSYIAPEVYGYENFPSSIMDAAKGAEEILKQLAEGDVALVTDAGTVTAESRTIASNTSAYYPTFNIDDPLDQDVDPDRIEAVVDERA